MPEKKKETLLCKREHFFSKKGTVHSRETNSEKKGTNPTRKLQRGPLNRLSGGREEETKKKTLP